MRLDTTLRNKTQIISIEVTDRCNLSSSCSHIGERGEEHKDITIETLQKLKDVIQEQKKIILCGIGESFLYPRLYELIHEFPKQKFYIVTNGTIPINFSKLNIHENVEQIVYTIDAVEQSMLNQMENKYYMNHLISNLMEYHMYYRSQTGRIQQVLNCTINETNLGQTARLVHFAHEYHMDTIHLSLPKGKDAFIQEHQYEIIKDLEKAKEMASHYGIQFVDPWDSCCISSKWVIPYITLDGNIFACAEDLSTGHKLGNLKNISLEKALKGVGKDLRLRKKCEDCTFFPK